MTFDEYWGILRRSLAFVVLAPCLGALVAFGVSKAATPVYQAQATIFVSVETVGAVTSGLTAQQQMDGYAGLATGADVLGRAALALDTSTTASELAGRVAASVKPSSTMLVVSATAPAANEAAAIANAIASATAQEISQRGSKEIVMAAAERGRDAAAKIIVQADVVTEATPPSSPTSPRTRTNTALGFLLGLIVGVAAPIARESLRPTVRNSRDLEDAAGAPFLGTVRLPESADDLTLVRAALAAQSDLKPPGCLVVGAIDDFTPVGPVAAGLASVLANEGTRVLLVEADSPSTTPGLSELLTGACTVDQAVVAQEGRRYDLVPAGRSVGQSPSFSELSAFFASLKQRYDWVVVQAASLNSSAEAVVLSAAADGAVVVADQHRTEVKATTEGTDALHRTGARVLGAVLV